MRPIAAALAALLAAGAAAAQVPPPAREIARVASSPPALILQGVVVPAGAETFYLSGQVPDPIDAAKAGKPGLTAADYGDTRTQTLSALAKIRRILAAHGYRMADVIRLTMFVAGDPKLGGEMDLAGMNEGFRSVFGADGEAPQSVARSTVKVAGLVAPAYLIEVEAVAARLPR